jgi:hypothetical protein
MEPGSPGSAAGRSAAVFTGTVLSITDPVPPASPREAANRVRANGPRVLVPPNRIVRLRVSEALSGVLPQAEVDVVTGMGGGDCGFPFETGKEFFVYADRNPEGTLRTHICSRTRPVAQAAEDLAYLRAAAGTPETGRLTVRTSYPGFSARPGIQIIAEAAGERHSAVTNAAGDAVFENLPPGEYRVRSAADGDLPDDPKFQLGARGFQEVTLIRTLRIRGRLITRQGQPATGTGIELRSTSGEQGPAAGVGDNGAFEILLSRPGRYYLGVHLKEPATADSPYPRWFHPGTTEVASATVIEFSGKPGIQTYELTLPDPKLVRLVEGYAFLSNETPANIIRLFAIDRDGQLIAQASTDPNGRFRLRLPADEAYQLHAVWPGNRPETAMSSVPISIEPGPNTASLRIALNQSGNSYLELRSRLARPKL